MAGELGGCALSVLRGLDVSSTFREVIPALLDLWMAALQGERVAFGLVQQGALGVIAAVLRAPQFRGVAAAATVPGAILRLRRAAVMAIGSLTVDSRASATTALAVGLLRDTCFVMAEHPDDPELQTWGCGALGNMLYASTPPPDVLAPAAAAIASTLQTATTSPPLCSAVIAARVLSSTASGLAVATAAGLRDLVAAASSRLAVATASPPVAGVHPPAVWPTLEHDIALTLACMDRVPVAVDVCGCTSGTPLAGRTMKLQAFVLCQTCSNVPTIVCTECAMRSHVAHVLSGVMFDSVVCGCAFCYVTIIIFSQTSDAVAAKAASATAPAPDVI